MVRDLDRTAHKAAPRTAKRLHKPKRVSVDDMDVVAETAAPKVDPEEPPRPTKRVAKRARAMHDDDSEEFVPASGGKGGMRGKRKGRSDDESDVQEKCGGRPTVTTMTMHLAGSKRRGDASNPAKTLSQHQLAKRKRAPAKSKKAKAKAEDDGDGDKQPVKKTRTPKAGARTNTNANYQRINIKGGWKSGASFKSGRKWVSGKRADSRQGYGGRKWNGGEDNPFDYASLYGNDQAFNFGVDSEDESFLTAVDDLVKDHEEKKERAEMSVVAPEDITSKKLHAILKKHFGFSRFREGQKKAIKRILRNKSTLLIIPTGEGKSLCYQFVSYFRPNELVVVVSPLLALMKDQEKNLPPFLKDQGVCLNSSMSLSEQIEVIDRIKKNEVRILFVSPEKFTSENFIKLCQGFPAIAFVCVDEESIRKLLEVEPEGVIRSSSIIRTNICPSVSVAGDRERALVELLRSPRFTDSKSIVVYCMLQKQTEAVAGFLIGAGFDAAAYHAGKHHDERTRMQNLFFQNKLRIIVATVAFGMGINKPDIDAVVHFSLPKSLENYVQEIGRAGRDGRQAHSHLFLAEDDFVRLRSLAFSDSIDPFTIASLCKKVFVKQAKGRQQRRQSEEEEEEAKDDGYLVGLKVEELEKELDVRPEVISTILTYLELEGYIRLISEKCPIIAKINFFDAPGKVAANNKLMAAILDHATKGQNGAYMVDLTAVLNEDDDRLRGATIYDVQNELRRLKNTGGMGYELLDPAFLARVLRTPEDITALAHQGHSRTRDLELSHVSKIEAIYETMKGVAHDYLHEVCAADYKEKTNPRGKDLRTLTAEYFNDDATNEGFILLAGEKPKVKEGERPMDVLSKTQINYLRSDIKVFLNRHGSETCEWEASPFWRKHREVDFNYLLTAANEEIVVAHAQSRRTAHLPAD
ncbi:ATPdependent DNA helicase, RecQ subfamily protein [Acanthamoeba castellanii str. Neff]|uniref:DNA 3'-5' helicase n=1 Tax=Acanthamoeba castellanii (strain ATCC 30010 / Neff) TaxID=1257118 RepID=L8H7F9_ACACF|nr:ATPdependent DNA helicase, RecQ subfamily protein [Acanthamoeba castellanii str. Neff]ELR21070.1 ATPdependent DNA helicase, RecQ subfamily protein [Acanthamoeba castellanii str. Neff]